MTARFHPISPPHRRRAFTLIELMVVIGIIALMLVALIPAVNSLSKSSGRKAAVGSLLGAIEQARANAIKTGRTSYLVFPTFTTATPATMDRYHFKSFAVFEDDPGNPNTPKQLTNWKTLPTGIALRAQSGTIGALTDLPNSAAAGVAFNFSLEPNASPVFHWITFDGDGTVAVTSNTPPNNVVNLAIFEGRVDGTTEVVTGTKTASGAPAALETIKVAHLTGRAEVSP